MNYCSKVYCLLQEKGRTECEFSVRRLIRYRSSEGHFMTSREYIQLLSLGYVVSRCLKYLLREMVLFQVVV